MVIERNVPLNDKNEFRTGGSASYFCEPNTIEDFSYAISYANSNKLPIEILGRGANVLVSDDGFNGLIIRPFLKEFSQNSPDSITVGAGVSIQECIDSSLDKQLLGLEEFSGIPGTIGGAVYMNVHYFRFFISDFLTKATIIEKSTGKIFNVTRDWFQFGYDQSKLHEKEFFLANATFKVKPASHIETAYARGRRDEIIRHRNSRYPTSHTCGSFFRNFEEKELTNVVNAKKLPFIAYYLDQLGIKGALSHGGAIVSYQHANMIVTNEIATSTDVVMLARNMQELVIKNFGIIPVSECQFVGFKEFPLLTISHHVKSSHDNFSSVRS